MRPAQIHVPMLDVGERGSKARNEQRLVEFSWHWSEAT
jgi:hypothetical protein